MYDVDCTVYTVQCTVYIIKDGEEGWMEIYNIT